MAGSEGSVSGQTDLLTGWSCVVHRPSEDPEPSSLPSTVDITAFSSEPNVAPTQEPVTNCCSNTDSDSASDSENSGSDASGSCSYTSSDSDSSTSSQGSSASSTAPQFSVTSSQTNGLRLTIANVRKSCSSPAPKEETKPQKDKSTPEKTEVSKESSSKADINDSINSVVKNLPSPKLSSSGSSNSGSASSSEYELPVKSVDKNVSKDSSTSQAGRVLRKTVRKVDKTDTAKKNVRSRETKSPRVATRGRGRPPTRSNKVASLPVSRVSPPHVSSSDSEASDSDDMLASCSLQEIRQEDLAAILPDQQECDAFGGFEYETRPDKTVPDVEDASGSEMELPTQLVNAAIQRVTESSSETESQPAAYASTLLQQFVQQQQLLNHGQSSTVLNNAESTNQNTAGNTDNHLSEVKTDQVKRKRGRPRKIANKPEEKDNNAINPEYCVQPNVSPDSGIQNSPDRPSSPEPSLPTNLKTDSTKSKSTDPKHKSAKHKVPTKTTKVEQKTVHKQRVSTFNLDRVLYCNTDRVLYPPRRKPGRPTLKVAVRKPGRPPKYPQNTELETENVAPSKTRNVQLVNTKSSQSEVKKVQKATAKEEKKVKKANRTLCDNEIVQLTSNTLSLSLGKQVKKEVPKNKSGAILNEICERVSKRLESNNTSQLTTPIKPLEENKSKANTNRKAIHNIKNKRLTALKSKFPTLKHLKVMHTKHKHKKHKKHKIKILRTISVPHPIQKVDTDIDKLIADFIRLCNLGTNKSQKENVPEVFKCVKRVTKKRKTETTDNRKKKKQTVNSNENKEHNSNEQRLPLKKRHYHVSTNDQKDSVVSTNIKQENNIDPKTNITKNGAVPTNKNTVVTKVVNEKNKTNTIQKPETNVENKIEDKLLTQNVSVELVKCDKIIETKDSEDIIGSHIDEAIEACINKYTVPIKIETNVAITQTVNKTEVKTPAFGNSVTATTPKKRHRLEEAKTEQLEKVSKKLDVVNTTEKIEKPPENNRNYLENVVTEIKNKKILNLTQEQNKKVDNIESIAQMITRKKNRLEDLTSNLVSKVTPTTETENDKKVEKKLDKNTVSRVSVIKSLVAKKIKPVSNEILDSVVNEKPTGIFMQTVDIELHIPSTTIQTATKQEKSPDTTHNLRKKKQEDSVEIEITTKKKEKIKNKEPVIPSEKPITNEEKSTVVINHVVRKKMRRRKMINRTGFPTLKKKKKKITPKLEPEENSKLESNAFDRIPRLGEEATTFIKRTQNCLLSVVALEKLQMKPKIDSIENDSISKWDCDFSECDSLPMDECHFQELELSKKSFDIKDRMTLRGRDSSPATSIETKSSDRIKRENKHRDSSTGSVRTSSDISELDKRIKRKRDASLEKTEKKYKRYEECSIVLRKRIRDVSPASSIEPFSDKKLKNDDQSSDDSKKNKKIPRWRKKFLVAGLFSDYYKENDEITRAKRRESALNKNKLLYNPEEHAYGLLPPPYHCGKYLRCRKVPFQLPHDLWWQHTHAQLPGRDIVPSWNYRKIRTNVYGIRVPTGVYEPQSCNCKGQCEDDCINRLVYAECPATHKCKNQKIQRHEWSPGLEKFMTDNKGWGVRTNDKIKKGDFILEYVGEVVADQEFKHRMETRYTHDTHHYCLHLDGGLVIDGHRMGGDGRFVNHSCQPNCEMQKWSVNGQFRMALFSLRDILPGEELTYDYNFSLFNPADGQVCKCGSQNCRGVIGGKSQRIKQCNNQQPSSETNNNHPGRVGRPRKNQARRTTGPKETPAQPQLPPVLQIPVVRPLSHQQKVFAIEHHCFLLRNLTKVKRIRERSVIPVTRVQMSTLDTSSAFMSQLNALRQPRNMRTRRLAQAEDNPELGKAARLAEVLKDLYSAVATFKDEKNEFLASPFMNLPTKRKLPEYYQRISEPIDLSTIEQNISTGVYRSVESFDTDMNKLFANSVKFFGRTTDLGIAATRLRKVYGQAKVDNASRIENALGQKLPANFLGNGNPGGEEEDVIRCICGLFRDEGLMIQCERCLVWQHCECVKADPAAASYHCERCVPRDVELEIPLDEYTEHGHRYYISLLRGDLQLRQGDTVYVLRDIPIPGTDKKHTYDTVGKVEFNDLDIFRIERLWKDSKTGQRFAFGHHYLRPHETYHEPTRRFFPNEVMRVPLYEVVPVELIMSPCWVLDINTYCKGRPIGSIEEHVYICEYRVDKSARLFSKISRAKFPICTKNYAFDRFDQKLKISRTYTPHELDQAVAIKPRGRKPVDNEEHLKEHQVQQIQQVQPIIRSREEQRAHLNGILLHLLGRLPTKQVLDVSYLLEGGRRRKKQNS